MGKKNKKVSPESALGSEDPPHSVGPTFPLFHLQPILPIFHPLLCFCLLLLLLSFPLPPLSACSQEPWLILLLLARVMLQTLPRAPHV
jgi:hypothetical protein